MDVVDKNYQWYVYTLRYPDNTVFYVGKGTGNRVKRHAMRAISLTEISYKSAKIIDLYLNGESVQEVIEAYFRVEQHAYVYESMLIEAYGIQNLTNRKPGTRKRELEVTEEASYTYLDTTEEDTAELINLIESIEDKAELLDNTTEKEDLILRISNVSGEVWKLWGEVQTCTETKGSDT